MPSGHLNDLQLMKAKVPLTPSLFFYYDISVFLFIKKKKKEAF